MPNQNPTEPLAKPYRTPYDVGMNTAAAPDLRRIGDTIRDRRERLGLRQHQAADRAELSLFWYGAIENGREAASRVTYMRIAAALDIPLDEMDQLTGLGGAA